MRITIQVKPNSKKPGVEKRADGTLLVRVAAPPIEGRANEAVRELLAEYFSCSKSKVTILRGDKGKTKIVEIA